MHATLLEELQRLRGTVYLEDGAIKPEQLSADGCHRTPEDQRAWHLLVLAEGQVRACGWYLEHQHARSIQDLRVRSCPLVKSGDWKHTVDRAID
ncbi:MAG TPA: hypothetical protein VFO19_21065, partial [Vicinamibacterales bacterium]|nr:hypothetical protein [Vicinamibacterales bacterium]